MDPSPRLNEVRHFLLSQWFSLPLLWDLLISQDCLWGVGAGLHGCDNWWELEIEAQFVGYVNIGSHLLYSLIWYDTQVLSSPDAPATGCFGP